MDDIIHIHKYSLQMYFVYFWFIKWALSFMHSNIYSNKKCGCWWKKCVRTSKHWKENQFMWQTRFLRHRWCGIGNCWDRWPKCILFVIFPACLVSLNAISFLFTTLVLWNQCMAHQLRLATINRIINLKGGGRETNEMSHGLVAAVVITSKMESKIAHRGHNFLLLPFNSSILFFIDSVYTNAHSNIFPSNCAVWAETNNKNRSQDIL